MRTRGAIVAAGAVIVRTRRAVVRACRPITVRTVIAARAVVERPRRAVITTRTVVERTGRAFITSDISIIRALTGPIRPARARISEVTNRAVVAAARPILAERRTGIAEGAAVVARLALATRTVVVGAGRAVVVGTSRAVVRARRAITVGTLIAARAVVVRAGRAVVAAGAISLRLRTDATGFIAAGAFLRVPALLLRRGVFGLGAEAAVARALAAGLSGRRLTRAALGILIRRLLRAVARLETLRAAAASGLLVLGHGVLLGFLV